MLVMMRQSLMLAALGAAFLAGASCSGYAAPNDATGVWLTEDAQARVRVEPCVPTGGEASGEEHVCGYLVWLRTPNNPDGTVDIDEHNPDPARQSRPLLGMQIMLGLTPNDDDRYEGKIYDADRGKDFDVEVWSDRPDTLKVKGCLIAFLCKTQTWRRVADVAPGELTGPAGSETGPTPDPEWMAPPQASATASP